MIGNWLKEANFPPIGRSSFDMYWALSAALTEDMKKGGSDEPPLRGGVYGSYTEPLSVLCDEVERTLNVKLVYRGYNGFEHKVGYALYVLPEGGAISISENEGVEFFCRKPEDLAKIRDILNKYITNTPRGKVHVVAQGDGGPYLQQVNGLAGVDFEAENYMPDVAAEFQHVVKDLNSKNPCGRVILLDGTPGTGKTFLVRALTNMCPEATFVILPSEMITSLAGPSFVSILLQEKGDGPMVLVIEDADNCLVPRAADNMGSISALLNLSDGILGSLLDLRILATTNAGHLSKSQENIDEAIMRPGRLCRRIPVGKLSAEQASKVYKRLLGKDWEEPRPCTLAEVYRAARDGGYMPAATKKPAIGFTQPSPPLIRQLNEFADLIVFRPPE